MLEGQKLSQKIPVERRQYSGNALASDTAWNSALPQYFCAASQITRKHKTGLVVPVSQSA